MNPPSSILLLSGAGVLFACAFALALVPPVRRFALGHHVVDHPGDRKIHRQPTPYLGGLAVVLSCYAALTVLFLVTWVMPVTLASPAQPWQPLVALLAGSALLFGVGLWDDLTDSRHAVLVKLAGQAAAASLILITVPRLDLLTWPWLNTLCCLVWIIGITNAFNLLDNMDGLMSGVAMICLSFFLGFAIYHGHLLVALPLSVLIGALAGFLFFNFNPARIFLGDAGSLAIGFVIAALPVLEFYQVRFQSPSDFLLATALVFGIPLTDTLSVIAIRLWNRAPIYHGDQNHLSHQLVRRGFSQRSAVFLLYLLCFTFTGAALILPHIRQWMAWVIIAQAFVCAVISTLLLLRRTTRPTYRP